MNEFCSRTTVSEKALPVSSLCIYSLMSIGALCTVQFSGTNDFALSHCIMLLAKNILLSSVGLLNVKSPSEI
jgi:hypothetical protein